MFESLKKKLKSLFTSEEKVERKAPKKTKAKNTKKTQEKPKTQFSKSLQSKSKTSKEKKLDREVDELIEESTPEEPVAESKPSFFSKLTSRFTTQKITEAQVSELFDELEIILLENNVALEVVDEIKKGLITDLVGTEVQKGSLESRIKNSLKDSISKVLHEPPSLLEAIKKKNGPYTVIFFGINGSGKTTSIAKLAHYLKENKISCVLAAGDTFRAASIEQLETHAQRLGVEVIKHTYGSDPAAVAFDAIKHAEKNHIKAVLIDTAGRMYTKENLIREMEKVIRVVNPDLKIFVGESITGNDATEQARTFNEAIGIDGIILTKADVDDKGGTALSVSYITKKPIYFLGQGQGYNDLKPFKKSDILKHLGLD